LKIDDQDWQIQIVQDDLNFPIVNFPFLCSTFQHHLQTEFLCISIIAIFQGLYILSEFFASEKTADTDINDRLKSSVCKLIVIIIKWLITKQCLSHKWKRICLHCCSLFALLFPCTQHFRVWVLLIVEDPTVKCRTAITLLFV